MSPAAPTPNLGYGGISRLWTMPGGVHPPEQKDQSNSTPIQSLPLPRRLYIPMDQHAGAPALPVVSAGERVLKGQLIGRDATGRGGNVHASTSGTVQAITEHTLCHPSGLTGTSVILEPDGEECWFAHAGIPDYLAAAPEALLERVREAGIVGLGGAGFPTAAKLAQGNALHTLILNGAECEPYISCDDRLMRERAAEVVEGGRILMRILGVERCLIGVEDNKPEAIEALWTALRASGEERMHLATLPTRYPSGGQKQLIYILTGQEVPSGKRSSTIGVLMHNVMTAAAVYRAVARGEPLVSRIVTVTGAGIGLPGNYEVLLGTPMADLLNASNAHGFHKLIVGGPMMGFTLRDAKTPVTKIANCLLAPTMAELPPPPNAKPCIRCGLCVDACPAKLLPQQLFWFARAGEDHKAVKHHLFDCIECGACAYVCPSDIPLVSYYRVAKDRIRAEREAKRQAEHARRRFEAREARLAREAAEKAERLKRATEARRAELAANPEAQAAIAAALARSQAAEPAAVEPVAAPPEAAADPAAARKAEIAAAIARAKARKTQGAVPAETSDSHKDEPAP
ncbi:MAG: electron transport complex subunit RsxC [Gammaproteobacteria bacterium]|nr:electron transport complex subunit RsxC [Gammaproteobacteria bacterium]